jgi:hypothetical protein
MTREHKVLQGCVLQLIYFPRAHLCPKTEEQTVGVQSNITNWQGNLNVTSQIGRVTKVTSQIGMVTKVTSQIGRVTKVTSQIGMVTKVTSQIGRVTQM